jgi:hypothetical protein
MEAGMLRLRLFKSLNTWIVSLYKVFGFGVLVALFLGMTSFLTANVFFMFNRSWIVPIILSPNNDRVLSANVAYMEQRLQADKLRTERTSIESQLTHIRHAIKLHEQFQANFVRALQVEEQTKLVKLKRLADLGRAVAANSKGLQGAAKRYKELTKQELDEQYSKRLIAQDDLIRGKYLVSQLDASDLTQKEKNDDLLERIEATRSEIRAQSESNDVIIRSQVKTGEVKMLDPERFDGTRKDLNIDVLMREQQYLSAEIAKSELASRIAPLEMQLAKMDELLAEQDKMIARLDDSPYVRVAKEGAPVTIAFVSYENLSQAKPGAKVLGCYLSFVVCQKAGTVSRVIEGEVTARHPMTNRDVRGVMVEIQLADNRWAEKAALMLNRAPLLL